MAIRLRPTTSSTASAAGSVRVFASRNAYMAYYVLYAQGFNEGGVFVAGSRRPAHSYSDKDIAGTRNSGWFSPATRRRDRRPSTRTRSFESALAGKEFVPIRAEDVGVEAVDDHTLRITARPSPLRSFVGMMAHQFFRPVHRASDRKVWRCAGPDRRTSSRPAVRYKLKEWLPYDRIVVVRDPMYWDAGQRQARRNPLLSRIEEQTTMMNLYKAGEVDAIYNHTVPAVMAARHPEE